MNTPELIKSIMENQPEYSAGMVLSCEKWDYKRCVFIFRDTEQDFVYQVNMKMLLKGFKKMKEDLLSGKIKLDMDIALYDPANWDAVATDALVQYAIFNEAIYG